MIARLDRVETKLSNLTSKNAAEIGASQAGPSTMLPVQQPNIQSSNFSSTTSPSFAPYVQELGATQPIKLVESLSQLTESNPVTPVPLFLSFSRAK